MSNICTDQESIYSDIDFCQGKKSLPGIRNHVFGISKRDIVTWPKIDRSTKVSLAEVPVYKGDFVLAPTRNGTGWLSYLIRGSCRWSRKELTEAKRSR